MTNPKPAYLAGATQVASATLTIASLGLFVTLIMMVA